MKKIFLLVFVAVFLSCNLENKNSPSFQSKLMPITSVNTPSEFIFGEVYEITVSYTRDNGCYEFNNFIIQPNGNTRTITVVDNVYDDPDCSSDPIEAEVSFNFRVLSVETYVFQFYQGEGVNDEDEYLIIEIPVLEQ